MIMPASSNEIEKKIEDLRERLNQLAQQLILRSPEAQHLVGQIKVWEEVLQANVAKKTDEKS